MSVSFAGVGQVCATFLGDGLSEGQVVKVSGNGTVGACAADDDFCGVTLCCKEDACSVQVAGFVSVSYSGAAPSVGWCALAADGSGGVKTTASGGRMRLVACVDPADKSATILL